MGDDLINSLTAFLKELTLQKEAERKKMEREAVKSGGLLSRSWTWYGTNAENISKLLAVASILVGAVWGLNTHFEQQRLQIEQQRLQIEQQQRDEALRRQTSIATFSSDFSDVTKRNSAVYAVTVLAGEQAIPFLFSQLREYVRPTNLADESFKNALAQSLISLGTPSLKEALRLNRGANPGNFNVNDDLIAATQPIILPFFESVGQERIDTWRDFSGIKLRDGNLAFQTVEGLVLNRANLDTGDWCKITLTHAILDYAWLYDLNFNAAVIADSSLVGTKFQRGALIDANFHGVLGSSSRFLEINISESDFSDSDFSSSTFERINAFHTSFVNTELKDAQFTGAYLEDADFTGANLENVKFFDEQSDMPTAPPDLIFIAPGTEFTGVGAFVRGANFDGATNLSEQNRIYLCKWGAINVPGDCAGIPSETISYELRPPYVAPNIVCPQEMLP